MDTASSVGQGNVWQEEVLEIRASSTFRIILIRMELMPEGA
jgi:hypothetical protein